MATLKQRLHRKSASGTYDTIHFETSADCITGILSVVHGGTGVTNLNALKTSLGISTLLPSGVIVMWSGTTSNIPTGWALCNGANGTPDLRNRFIVGAGSTYSPKATGGEATHKLTTAEIPSHNHVFSGSSHTHSLSLSGLTTSSAGGHTHEFTNNAKVLVRNDWTGRSVGGSGMIVQEQTLSSLISSSGSHTHSISGSGSIGAVTQGGIISNTGSGVAHNNLPPYYALCFIMKL